MMESSCFWMISQKRMEPHMKKGKNQKHKKTPLVVSCSLCGSRKSRESFCKNLWFSVICVHMRLASVFLLERARPLCSWASSGFTVEQQQDLAFEAFGICECVVCGCVSEADNLGECFSISPLLLAVGEHSCQPQRVNVISSDWHGKQPTIPLKLVQAVNCQSAPLTNIRPEVSYHSQFSESAWLCASEWRLKMHYLLYFQMKLFLV